MRDTKSQDFDKKDDLILINAAVNNHNHHKLCTVKLRETTMHANKLSKQNKT